MSIDTLVFSQILSCQKATLQPRYHLRLFVGLQISKLASVTNFHFRAKIHLRTHHRPRLPNFGGGFTAKDPFFLGNLLTITGIIIVLNTNPSLRIDIPVASHIYFASGDIDAVSVSPDQVSTYFHGGTNTLGRVDGYFCTSSITFTSISHLYSLKTGFATHQKTSISSHL